jgi:hypothetical protein
MEQLVEQIKSAIQCSPQEVKQQDDGLWVFDDGNYSMKNKRSLINGKYFWDAHIIGLHKNNTFLKECYEDHVQEMHSSIVKDPNVLYIFSATSTILARMERKNDKTFKISFFGQRAARIARVMQDAKKTRKQKQ